VFPAVVVQFDPISFRPLAVTPHFADTPLTAVLDLNVVTRAAVAKPE
jgi:hypothetical protein